MKLELHNPTSPYGLVLTRTALSNTDGTFSVSIPGAQANSSYYLTIKGRNSIETWSKNPVLLLSGNNLYNFSLGSSPLLRLNNSENTDTSDKQNNTNSIKPEHPE